MIPFWIQLVWIMLASVLLDWLIGTVVMRRFRSIESNSLSVWINLSIIFVNGESKLWQRCLLKSLKVYYFVNIASVDVYWWKNLTFLFRYVFDLGQNAFRFESLHQSGARLLAQLFNICLWESLHSWWLSYLQGGAFGPKFQQTCRSNWVCWWLSS